MEKPVINVGKTFFMGKPLFRVREDGTFEKKIWECYERGGPLHPIGNISMLFSSLVPAGMTMFRSSFSESEIDIIISTYFIFASN